MQPDHIEIDAYPPTRLVLLLCALALTLDIVLGSFVMLRLGIHYESPGGNLLVKIHPGSYVALAAVALHFLGPNHPLRVARALALRSAGLCLYCAGMMVVFGYALAVRGASGVAFLLDSFFVPGLLALVLIDAAPRARQRLVTWLIVVIAVNALCAIGEARLHQRLFPYMIAGVDVTEDHFRATALAGHPLRNAMLTTMAMIAVATKPWPRIVCFGFLLLFTMALLAFGGRTALVIAGAGVVALAVHALHTSARAADGTFVRTLLGAFVALIAGAVTFAAVFTTTNLGGRIREGLLGGDSSTAARLQLFDIFKLTDLDGLLGGYSATTIDAMATVIGLLAVENFWIYLLLFLGVIGFAVWLPAFLAGLAGLWRHVGFAGRVLLVCVVIVASANNSLGKKDTVLAIAFALVIGIGAAERRAPGPVRQAVRLGDLRGGVTAHAG
jgi:hypothetical protein